MADVLFEDAWLLIVAKPSGMPTQATRTGERGLYDILRAERPYVGLHHRLDRPASGAILFTLDPSMNVPIAAALRERTLGRHYAAVVDGRTAPGEWTWPVARKPARTDIEVVGHGAGLSALRCTLHTGRKHQVRVHAAMAGHPIVGDRRYGGEVGRRWPRLALHAERLTLQHPATGERISAEAPLPTDMAELWERASVRC